MDANPGPRTTDATTAAAAAAADATVDPGIGTPTEPATDVAITTVTETMSDAEVVVVDLPLTSLIPLRKRTTKKALYERLESNIRAVGLIEPLLVHPYEGQHFILDGYLRYLVLSDLGVEMVPCILIPTLDAYTPNRQVNYITGSQKRKMLEHALTVVDEDRLKSSLALKTLRHSFSKRQRETLCPEIQQRVRDERLARSAAMQLVHVNADRQREILHLVELTGDASSKFIRAQVLRTPAAQQVHDGDGENPWKKSVEVHKKLADRLNDAEKNADFYQSLYRQYAHDLTVLAIYVRNLLANSAIFTYLNAHFPEDVAMFREIIQQTEPTDQTQVAGAAPQTVGAVGAVSAMAQSVGSAVRAAIGGASPA